MPSKDQSRTSDPAEVDNGNAFAWLMVAFVVVPLLLVATYFIGQVPYSVKYFRQFDSYAGKRVRFICHYKGKVGMFGHLEFEGRPILVKTRLDTNYPSPEAGGLVEVVGELKHLGKPVGGIDGIVEYVITNGKFHRASSR